VSELQGVAASIVVVDKDPYASIQKSMKETGLYASNEKSEKEKPVDEEEELQRKGRRGDVSGGD
jgi:hypothetical protein